MDGSKKLSKSTSKQRSVCPPAPLLAWGRGTKKPAWKGERAMSFAYITEEGAYIQKRGGNFTVGRNRECIMEIPAESLEGLTLIDTVQVSSKAIVELLRLGIPVPHVRHLYSTEQRRTASVLRIPPRREEPPSCPRLRPHGGMACRPHRRNDPRPRPSSRDQTGTLRARRGRGPPRHLPHTRGACHLSACL